MGRPRSFDDWAKAAALSGWSADFDASARGHLAAGSLSDLATVHILLESPLSVPGDGWALLRQAVIDDLATRPAHGAMVLNLAVLNLEFPRWSETPPRREGADHVPTFTVVMTMPQGDGQLATIGRAGTVKLARQRAAVLMLAALAEATPPTFPTAQAGGAS